MCRRPVALAVEFRIVRLILLEHIIDGREQHPGNGDDGFLEGEITIADFWEPLSFNDGKSAWNKQWFDVGSGPADSGGFLLPSTFIILRRKPSPGAEVLRGGEHGHIHSDFRDNSDCGKGLDTRRRHNKVE